MAPGTIDLATRFPIDFYLRGRERRRHPRTQIRMEMRCVFLDPDGPRILDLFEAVNISKGGVGAISDHRYYPGQRVLTSILRAGESKQRNIYATVVRCKPDREGGFQIGLAFDAATIGDAAEVRPALRVAA
ncbi:hypothetical protein LCGC14_0276570 [marine sediment metagenome]|uniref:PilZ domain-containing protein n=1 Tax=marine sediment metagenome TaxID=412755 RepID=A0A0F9X2I1_9ZZZZ|nr:PilZ domain-containing protein [Phycisphaerae bacterium]HDZ42659.1 PilZ domain-containing protein [Phycisphaerae bacterium]